MVPGIERVGVVVGRDIRLGDPAPVCLFPFFFLLRTDAGHRETMPLGQPDIFRVVDLEPFADLAHGRIRKDDLSSPPGTPRRLLYVPLHLFQCHHVPLLFISLSSLPMYSV